MAPFSNLLSAATELYQIRTRFSWNRGIIPKIGKICVFPA
nr:MAG TPA: hypothetical protein [Caudoviricetes sp.]